VWVLLLVSTPGRLPADQLSGSGKRDGFAERLDIFLEFPEWQSNNPASAPGALTLSSTTVPWTLAPVLPTILLRPLLPDNEVAE